MKDKNNLGFYNHYKLVSRYIANVIKKKIKYDYYLNKIPEENKDPKNIGK